MKEYLFTVFDEKNQDGQAQYTINANNLQSALARLLNIVSNITEDDIIQINITDKD